jgi:ABC-type sulfate/molybdate transport systems ATPase subunit
VEEEAIVAIAVRNLSKRYGTFQAVDDVSFDVPAGQLVALLGPSGSGKSTILRIIAGLEMAETGTVELTGEDATAVPIQHRGVGFVFQHYALFRHMTVRDNIAFGLKVRKLSRSEIRARVDELLDLVQLQGYATRYPSQLSGGQRQRVALARALARGRIEQMGPPQVLYEHPATPFVTGFLGAVNVLRGQSAAGQAVLGNGIQVPIEIDGQNVPVSVYVRPHDLDLTYERNGAPAWPGRVLRVIPLGSVVRLEIALSDDTDVRVELSRDRYAELEPQIGQALYLVPRDLKVFLDQSQPD